MSDERNILQKLYDALEPHSEEVTLTTLPKCTFCSKEAEYDFKSGAGPWAFGCLEHYAQYRLYRTLGYGKGQKLRKANGEKTQESSGST